jgi:hypothetical protein
MKTIFLWILLLVIIIYIINLKIYEGYTETKYVNYPGNDIWEHKYITKGQCENVCNSKIFKSRCKGYVTNFIYGTGPGKCWLKSKFESNNAIVDPGTITNIK